MSSTSPHSSSMNTPYPVGEECRLVGLSLTCQEERQLQDQLRRLDQPPRETRWLTLDELAQVTYPKPEESFLLATAPGLPLSA